jgi:hypothetical protein
VQENPDVVQVGRLCFAGPQTTRSRRTMRSHRGVSGPGKAGTDPTSLGWTDSP